CSSACCLEPVELRLPAPLQAKRVAAEKAAKHAVRIFGVLLVSPRLRCWRNSHPGTRRILRGVSLGSILRNSGVTRESFRSHYRGSARRVVAVHRPKRFTPTSSARRGQEAPATAGHRVGV